MDIIQKLSEELSIRPSQAEAAVKLLDEGNTVPFIARYRKEATGSLDDEQLRALCERLAYLRGLEKRKEEVRRAISEQGKMTPEIEQALQSAEILAEIDGRAVAARERRMLAAAFHPEMTPDLRVLEYFLAMARA